MEGQRADELSGPGKEIPDKLYFRIGEVSRIAGVKPYVLRFWETQFPSITPRKSGSGHRLYRRKDVEMVLLIQDLLHERRFTIEGARKHLDALPRAGRTTPNPASPQQELPLATPVTLDDIRRELLAILALLGG